MPPHPLLDGMNAQQQAAITADAGPVLVLAGPGSGKTAVLTRRIAWLIRERDVLHHRIMAVTFTNKATDEMRSRVENFLGDNIDDMQIGTFHRVSARLLRRSATQLGYRPGWKIMSTNQQYWIIRRLVEHFADKDASFSHVDVRKAISLSKNRLILPDNYPATDEFSETARRVYQAYQADLLNENLMDVDDLLLQFAILLRDYPAQRLEFQRVFDCLLIDEFQDTNRAQYEIVKLLAPPQNNIFVVGDEDQSIYGFRGADYRNLQSLREDFPNLRQILLEQNYRSTQTILDAARAVINHNAHRTPKALVGVNGRGGRIKVYEASSALEEAEYVQDRIQYFCDRTRLRYGDFAVMYRKNVQSSPLKSVLHLHGVPFKVVNTIDFDQRREVKDIMAMIHLACRSDFVDHVKRVAEFKAFGISKSGMTKLLDWLECDELHFADALGKIAKGASPLNARQSAAFARFADVLQSWRRLVDGGRLVGLVDQIIQDTQFYEHLERISKEDWELAERSASADRLRGLASAAAQAPAPFAQFAAGVASIKGDADSDPDKVALTTLHSAKGLEFPIVFIIGLNQDILPHVHEKDGPNDIDEERRLFYVGITRAEKKLYLTYARQKGLSDESLMPSEFLAELPEHLVVLH